MAEAIKGESDSYVQSSSGRTRKRGHFGTFRAFPVLISGVGRLIAFVDNQVVAGPTIENIKPTINFKPSVLDNRSIVARKDYIYIYTPDGLSLPFKSMVRLSVVLRAKHLPSREEQERLG